MVVERAAALSELRVRIRDRASYAPGGNNHPLVVAEWVEILIVATNYKKATSAW